jgi:hypothetical protein
MLLLIVFHGDLTLFQLPQIIARYNCERFSNRLARVGRLNNFRVPIAEGYFPKLDSLVASRSWPGGLKIKLKDEPLSQFNSFDCKQREFLALC